MHSCLPPFLSSLNKRWPVLHDLAQGSMILSPCFWGCGKIQHLLMSSLSFLEWCFCCCLPYLAGEIPTLLHPTYPRCSSPISLHPSHITSKPLLQCDFLIEAFVDLPELKLTPQVMHLLCIKMKFTEYKINYLNI